MKRYESYKDSGVKWLGEIPGHWEVTCLRRLLKRYSVKGHPNKPLLSVTREKGVILRGAKGDDGNNNIIPEDLSGYKHVKKGQFVINKMKSWQGSYGVSDFEGIVSPAYFVYDLDIADKRFFSWAIRSKNYVPFFMQYSKGIRVDQWDLTPENVKSIPFFIPPKSEQTAIANYLDSVTSKIDEAISQQQKMIDLLNERKQIIIQNAVTKGLDPNAKMKDSGVEWIGEIPENWEVKRFRFLFKEKNERNTLIKERKQLQFKMGNIVLKDRQDLTNEMINVISNYNIVKPGHIVLNGLNLNYDFVSQRIALVKERGIITSAYICIESINDINTSYYCYFMKAMDSKKLFHGMGSGIRLTLSYDNLKNLFFPYPSINDQIEIVKYLDSVSSKIDSSISQCNKMISLLQERKQIIINDVVTGKVKVI